MWEGKDFESLIRAKGAGALLLRPGLDVAPLVAGGGQERGRRGGTEPLPAIAGLAAAAEAATPDAALRLAPLRDAIEAAIAAIAPEARFPGRGAPRLPTDSSADAQRKQGSRETAMK